MQLVMIVSEKDTKRAIQNLDFIEKYLPVDEVVIIGNKKTGEIIKQAGKELLFLNEDTLYFDMNFKSIDTAIRERSGKEGRTGWYFQQFLKMAYAFICKEDYYLVWDGDTIPVREIALFDKNGNPYMALKEEYHELYFETLQKLLGLKKVREESFIAEHMLIHTEYMREMIEEIEGKEELKGRYFFEKILSAVEPSMLCSSGFSEYETFGTYMTTKHPEVYHCIPYSSCRYAVSMIGYNPSPEQIRWLAGKYEAISFEKWDRPICGLTKLSGKAWFRNLIGIEKYDSICSFRVDTKFEYQRMKRKVGRKIKKILGLNR